MLIHVLGKAFRFLRLIDANVSFSNYWSTLAAIGPLNLYLTSANKISQSYYSAATCHVIIMI